MPVAVDVVVVRFSPFSPDALADNATDTRDWEHGQGRAEPRFGVSVRADRPQGDETYEEVVDRLCRSTKLKGRTVEWALMSELNGFQLIADPTDEDPLHHLLGGPHLDELPDTVKLSSILSKKRRKNPTFGSAGATT